MFVWTSVGLFVADLSGWPGSVMFQEVTEGRIVSEWTALAQDAQDYPANTVRGRVCLGLRLDWDRDTTKETSDIYIKPR